jgi:alcohol dehydrogenase (cytochrome c)
VRKFSHAITLALLASTGLALPAAAQVTPERILNATAEPRNWLTYNGGYDSKRFSTLDQIAPSNIKELELKWIVQNQVPGAWESNPLIVEGIMYVTQRANDVMAIDAKTGRLFWLYRYTPAADSHVCCGSNNRGLAMLGDTLYMGTLDGHLLALDSKTGRPLWNVEVADHSAGYSITMAPLAIKDKIIVGTGGGEFGIRGLIAAYDAKTGKEAWRFYTIPGPGEKGHETWQGDDWKTGGASAWITGSYDPALNTLYWGIGNPGPDWNPAQRPGDNLYSDSVVALDPDTGKLKWHFQFTPNDPYDYDSVQVPVLADIDWQGRPVKAMLWANRNGYFYVLDRTNGKFLSGTPFVKVNWSSGLDANGRPIMTPPPENEPVFPGVQGGTNWYPPSYSPRTGLFYFSAWENYASIFRREEQEYAAGRTFTGGGFTVNAPTPDSPTIGVGRRGPINNWTSEVGNGATIALDPKTGKRVWTFPQFDVTDAGMLTTASDILFTGGREGYFYALDAKTGKELWKTNLGGNIVMAPVTFQVEGKQYISVISGNTLVTFGLRN